MPRLSSHACFWRATRPTLILGRDLTCGAADFVRLRPDASRNRGAHSRSCSAPDWPVTGAPQDTASAFQSSLISPAGSASGPLHWLQNEEQETLQITLCK